MKDRRAPVHPATCVRLSSEGAARTLRLHFMRGRRQGQTMTETKFRPLRGLLADAMAEVRTVASKAELVALATEMLGLPVGDVHVKPYCFDERIGWDTHIVTIDEFGVFGFTDGPLA